jgi:ATP-dependent protease HslVU (ClpYQ) peptidase subunit
MTCVVAIETSEGVLFGTDSGISVGNIITSHGPKLIHKRGVTIAYAGEIRAAQILEHEIKLPALPKRMSSEEYLYRNLIEPYRKAVKESGLAPEHSGLDCVVSLRGKVWEVTDNYTLLSRPEGYAVAGSGGDIARGAMEALEDWEPKQRAERALQISEKFCSSVRGPFYFYLSTG